MPSSSVALRGFFEEVDCFLQYKKNYLGIKLISDGTHVISNNFFLGRVYSKITSWTDLLTGGSNKERLQSAFVKASHASRKILKEYESIYATYVETIQMRIEGKDYDKAAFDKARWQMADFMQTLLPVYRKIAEHPEMYQKYFDAAFTENSIPSVARRFDQKGILWSLPYAERLKYLFQWTFTAFKTLAEAIDRLFGKPVVYPVVETITFEGKGPDKAIKNYILAKEHQFNAESFIQKIEKLGAIPHLEIVTGVEFPIEALSKVFQAEKRTDAEDAVLNEWVEKLCDWRHEYAAAYFHSALVDLAGQLNKSLPVEMIERQILEAKKEDAVHLFTTPDPQQVKFATEQIYPGAKLDGMDFVVGEKLFQIEGNTYWLANENMFLRVPQNRCILKLDETMPKELADKNLKFQRVDPQGRYALLEGDITFLIGKVWKSQDDDINEDEKPIYKALISQLKDFLKQNQMPQDLTPQYFALTADNKLKGWQSYKLCRVNSLELIDYVFKVANGNFTVYRKLLQESGIKDKYSKFKDLLLDTLWPKSKPFDYTVFDEETKKIAEEFVSEIKLTVRNATEELERTKAQSCKLEDCKLDDEERRKLNEGIVKVYDRSWMICRLPGTACKSVVNEYTGFV